MRCVAGQNDQHRADRPPVCQSRIVARADVEDTRNEGVDAILGMKMRHQFQVLRHLDPDCIGPGLRGLTGEKWAAASVEP